LDGSAFEFGFHAVLTIRVTLAKYIQPFMPYAILFISFVDKNPQETKKSSNRAGILFVGLSSSQVNFGGGMTRSKEGGVAKLSEEEDSFPLSSTLTSFFFSTLTP
jgi:hypothetical protein